MSKIPLLISCSCHHELYAYVPYPTLS
jgi:hypothetical protein